MYISGQSPRGTAAAAFGGGAAAAEDEGVGFADQAGGGAASPRWSQNEIRDAVLDKDVFAGVLV